MKIHKIALIFLATLGLAGAGAYYFWRQFTAVPDWYTAEMNVQSETTYNNSEDTKGDEQKPEENFSSSLDSGESLSKQQELDQIINRELSNNQRIQPFLKASQGVRTKVENNQLEIGTVIQPSAISKDELEGSEKNILEQAMDSFPRFNQQQVYVGLSGNFEVDANGELILDENTKVRIGNMHLSLAEASRRLGVNPEMVQQKLQENIQHLELEQQ